jgi:type IV pilus assembly protein PilC
VLQDLTVSLEKQDELRRKIQGAMIYPVILIVLAFAILLFLVTFALPKIAEVFSSGGFNPPLFSKVVFTIGLFVGSYVWVIVGLIISAVLCSFIFMRTSAGKRAFHWFVRRAPLVRTIAQKLALQRFASTLSSLLKSGVPIVNSLEITADAVGSEEIADALKRVARDGLSKGLTIGDAFRRETVFPNVITSLVAISEKAGHLDEVLKTLGTFYETEIDGAVKALISFIEPALLAGIGVVVGTIALSIIVPIYQLVGQF